MWEVDKNTEMRLHLVSRNKIKKPFLEGGLQIQDIAYKNLPFGFQAPLEPSLWTSQLEQESAMEKILLMEPHKMLESAAKRFKQIVSF